jgi:hypothetical protein
MPFKVKGNGNEIYKGSGKLKKANPGEDTNWIRVYS